MPFTEPRQATGAVASAAIALALLIVLAGNGGCEIAVPDTVPPFTCVPGPASCPTGEVCSPSTGQCVPKDSPDGGFVPTCSSLGCACSAPTDCTSGICGDELTVTTDLYAAASKTSFCTKPCCTSDNCDASTVCFATAAGGNLCARPEWLGRTAAPGQGKGGVACGTDSDCRSGLCAGAACADTCCSTAQSDPECAPGATCGFGNFPGRGFDVHYTATCASRSGTEANGGSCSANSQCVGNYCNVTCHDACRSSADCGGPSQECGYAFAPGTSSFVSVCSASPGTALEGAACTGNNDCQSGFCDSMSMLCTDVCYADADCTVPGWRCRPEIVVVAGVSFSYVACGS